MSKTVKRKSSVSGSKSATSGRSLGAREREKRPSVFERLGTKALQPGEPSRLCRHNIYHVYCPTCRSANSTLTSHSLSGAIKRNFNKELDTRPSGEGGSAEEDWVADWDQAELEYEDEKALERRRQLLQRELDLQMNTDLSAGATTAAKHTSSDKKRSSSSSSSSCSSSVATSSSSSSSSHNLDTKKNLSSAQERNLKKSSKMVYKEKSPSRKSSLSKKSPGPPRKMYSKMVSPGQASATSRKSPSKRLLSRKKDLDGRERSRMRSLSRERRRNRSKETSAGRHRQRPQHQPHPSRVPERKKDEDRGRRPDDRRDRRPPTTRQPPREGGDEMRMRDKMREKERCRQMRERERDRERERERQESRRDKCSRSSRTNHQTGRSRDPGTVSDAPPYRPSGGPPVDSLYHHHYRSQGERGRYDGSSERERVSSSGSGSGGYKESPSPREGLPRHQGPSSSVASSSYQDSSSSRMKRRGWEGGRYDSGKTGSGSRDWDHQTTDRLHDWQRSSKHAQDKDYGSMDKNKDIEWKRSGGGSSRDGDEGVVKRARLEEVHPPPPPPPPLPSPLINEPELSDISDDPDDILNRDDLEEGLENIGRVGDITSADINQPIDSEESRPRLSTASPNLDHRLIDQRMGEDEGMDSLDFEEISDEDLEEESKTNKGCGDVLVEDWASFIAECRVEKKPSGETEKTAIGSGKPWHSDNILRRIGVSAQYAGPQLFDSIQKQLKQGGGEGLVSEVGGLQSALRRRSLLLNAASRDKLAISARSDLSYRRRLCGLPVNGSESLAPFYQQHIIESFRAI